ncbi:MAG: hypothetical protein H0V10_15195 [Geodermatophilaceae bacterium]|nr:hypothetical protein [Geodermatophilaceae bacterium]
MLLISHGNLINWFVTRALGAPPGSWMTLLDYHCGLSVLLLRSDRPAVLVAYNDVGHLPPDLRGVDLPAELRA